MPACRDVVNTVDYLGHTERAANNLLSREKIGIKMLLCPFFHVFNPKKRTGKTFPLPRHGFLSSIDGVTGNPQWATALFRRFAVISKRNHPECSFRLAFESRHFRLSPDPLSLYLIFPIPHNKARQRGLNAKIRFENMGECGIINRGRP